MVSEKNLLFQGVIICFHVEFWEGRHSISCNDLQSQPHQELAYGFAQRYHSKNMCCVKFDFAFVHEGQIPKRNTRNVYVYTKTSMLIDIVCFLHGFEIITLFSRIKKTVSFCHCHREISF